jgi:hypothetical protein
MKNQWQVTGYDFGLLLRRLGTPSRALFAALSRGGRTLRFVWISPQQFITGDSDSSASNAAGNATSRRCAP